MYKDRVGGGSSRSEIVGVPLDRKRIINDALDKHLEKSSPSTSRVGGLNSSSKDKERLSVPSTSTDKSQQQLDHRDFRSASLSKNKCSDGLSFSNFFGFNFVECGKVLFFYG
jgi:casein kinase II subunit beta